MVKKYLSNKIRREQTTGERIRSIRKRKHIMVKDLAEMCDVTAKTMQNYEAGERQASQEKLDLIAEKLGVDSASIYYKFESIGDFFHFLFEAEREGLIEPVKCSDELDTHFEQYGIRTTNELVNEAIKAWCEEKALVDEKKISEDDYQNWQDAFPSDGSDEESTFISGKNGAVEKNKLDDSTELAATSSVFKRDGYMRLLSHSDHAANGINGTIVPQNIQNQICQYVNCTRDYLNDEYIAYSPQSEGSSFKQSDLNTLIEILLVMDKNADTEHFRVIQVQLSRIVIYNLKKIGFDRNTFRIKELLQDKLDYLFSGNKGRKRGAYFGFNVSELGTIRDLTGVSFQKMFTGDE